MKIFTASAPIENRIKELHHGFEIDRTSCTRFWANQLRVLITAAVSSAHASSIHASAFEHISATKSPISRPTMHSTAAFMNNAG